jgi:hypothetical protein
MDTRCEGIDLLDGKTASRYVGCGVPIRQMVHSIAIAKRIRGSSNILQAAVASHGKLQNMKLCDMGEV